jgi:hypothetical protein
MKNVIFLVVFAFLFSINVFGQSILPNYTGFWSETVYPGNEQRYIYKIEVTDILEYYPDRLDIIRNEIFARYGRPFASQKYKDYFSTKSWYVEKSNYSDNWLTKRDKENAEFISLIEKAGHCYDAIVEAKKNRIIYKGLHSINFSLFTAHTAALESKDLDGKPFIAFTDWDWLVVGNWIIVYEQLEGPYEEGRYQTQSFLIDPTTKKQIEYNASFVDKKIFERFIIRQEPIKLKYTKDW